MSVQVASVSCETTLLRTSSSSTSFASSNAERLSYRATNQEEMGTGSEKETCA